MIQIRTDYFSSDFHSEIRDSPGLKRAENVTSLVAAVFGNLERLVEQNLIPYSIRAMLRIVVILQQSSKTSHSYE